MKLSTKLILIFLLISIVPVFIVGYLAYDNGRQTIKQDAFDQLTSFNALKADTLVEWLSSNERLVQGLADHPLLRGNLTAMLAGDRLAAEYSASYQLLMDNYLAPVANGGSGLTRLLLLRGDDGLVLASTFEGEEGDYQADYPYFSQDTQGTRIRVHYSQFLEAPAITVSAPITDVHGELLGFLIGYLDTNRLLTIMGQTSELDRSVDTYLVSEAADLLITSHSVEGQNGGTEDVLAGYIEAGLSRENDIGFYENYRGVSVIGANQWMSQWEMHLLTEMDRSEAFAPVVRLENLTVAVGGGIAVVVAILALIFSRSLTRPLRRLSLVAAEIGQGNMDCEIDTSAQDEIGDLARAVSQMTCRLKQATVSRDDLVREVAGHQQTERKYDAIVEGGNEGIMIVIDMGLVFANRRLAGLLGYTVAEIEQLKITQIMHSSCLSVVFGKHYRSMGLTETPSLSEIEMLKSDGSLLPVEVTSSRIEYGDKMAIAVFVRDITLHRQMENTINEYWVELESKLIELQSAYDQLQELDQMKDAFLSTVSHELRTPLTSIKSFAEILLNYDEDEETQKEFLGIINDESDRLTRLINDFLDLAKIEAGRMQWQSEDVEIAEVIRKAIGATQSLSNEKGINVALDIEENLPPVLADRDRLIQVATNLLSNSIKFTPSDGVIRVKAEAIGGGNGESGTVKVSVSDNGIGISPEDQEHVFEKFRQVGDTLRDKPQGTGLGLPICREIIQHFHGTIGVESELGRGSTFYFELPTAQAIGQIVELVA